MPMKNAVHTSTKNSVRIHWQHRDRQIPEPSPLKRFKLANKYHAKLPTSAAALNTKKTDQMHVRGERVHSERQVAPSREELIETTRDGASSAPYRFSRNKRRTGSDPLNLIKLILFLKFGYIKTFHKQDRSAPNFAFSQLHPLSLPA